MRMEWHLYAGAEGDGTECESSQRRKTEEKGLQQQVCLIKYCLLFQVRRYLPQDCLKLLQCCIRVKHGLNKCDAPTIQESDLQDVVVKAIQEEWGGKDAFLFVLEKNIKAILENEGGSRLRRLTASLKNCSSSFWNRQMAKRNMGMSRMRFINWENNARIFGKGCREGWQTAKDWGNKDFFGKQINEPMVWWTVGSEAGRENYRVWE